MCRGRRETLRKTFCFCFCFCHQLYMYRRCRIRAIHPRAAACGTRVRLSALLTGGGVTSDHPKISLRLFGTAPPEDMMPDFHCRQS
jgi:hypothetical protein